MICSDKDSESREIYKICSQIFLSERSYLLFLTKDSESRAIYKICSPKQFYPIMSVINEGKK